jgi:hypothetical protein
MGFWDTLQQISGEMNAGELTSAPFGATLPNAALQLATDRLGEAPVGVADYQLDTSEAALYCFAEACGYERGDEFRPEARIAS